MSILWTFLLVIFSQATAHAGLITCGDNFNLSPGTNCSVTVDADFVINTSDCTGPYWLVARELGGDTIAFGLGSITFDLTAYLGTSIYIKVIDQPSTSSCESSYNVIDETAPAILCPMDTVGSVRSPWHRMGSPSRPICQPKKYSRCQIEIAPMELSPPPSH